MHYKEISLENVKRVLVCIFKYHGDVLLTAPVYSALKKALPKAAIDVYLFKETRPMLEGHPAISDFLEFDQGWRKLSLPRRILKELHMWKEVRKRNYDLVFNLTSGDRGALVARASKAPVRVGVRSGKYTDKLFTQLLRETKMPRHIVERNLDLVRGVGIFPKEGEKEVFFHVPFDAKESVKQKMPTEPFVLIHPTSRCDYKHWPKEHFTKVIQDLVALGETVVISSGPSYDEHIFIAKMLEPIRHLKVHNLAGKLTLKELGALIEKAKMLITVDSVPAHISSALKKPTLVIFGPSDDMKWGPWNNDKARVIRFDMPCKRCDQEGCGGSWYSDCLQKLSPSSVFTVIEEMLEEVKEEEEALVTMQDA